MPTTIAPATSATTASSTAAASTTTTTAAPPTLCGSSAAPPARYDHVVWIWMENHTADAVLQSSAAPFERDLARQCGSSATYRSVGSPSLPNYLGATSGSTHGVHDDADPSVHPQTGENLFRQVRAAGGTARSYEEAMPAPCQLHGSGRYAVKHNPQAYYVGGDDRAACNADNVPLGSSTGGALADDLANDHLPTFSFITPDLCNDTHDCAVAIGDRWLADWVSRIVASPAYRAQRTAVFVVWDEPTPMPLLVVSPTTPAGATASTPFDHYSLLRTTEDLLGLPDHLGQAATAASMRATFGL